MDLSFANVTSAIALLVSIASAGFSARRLYLAQNHKERDECREQVSAVKVETRAIETQATSYWLTNYSEKRSPYEEVSLLAACGEAQRQTHLLMCENHNFAPAWTAFLELKKVVTGDMFQSPERTSDPDRISRITDSCLQLRGALDQGFAARFP